MPSMARLSASRTKPLVRPGASSWMRGTSCSPTVVFSPMPRSYGRRAQRAASSVGFARLTRFADVVD